MNKLINSLKTRENTTLIKNFSYLSILQLFNLLIPLLTYPYLIRVLGKEIYGLVIYAQVITNYLLIIMNIGFYNLGIREISIHREDKNKISEIFNSIIITKFVFLIFAFLILWIVTLFLPEASNHKLLFILSMWVCFYDVIYPVWFFQGIEKMKYITYLTLVSRAIFLVLIFVLIKVPDDYLLVPVINGAGAVVSGLLALFIIFKKEKIAFYIPHTKIIYKYLKASTDFFISEASIKIFASSNKFIIGTLIGLTELAYYDLADKIISVFRDIPVQIVRSTIFPRVAKKKNLALVKKTTVLMSIYAIFAIAVINIFAPVIINFLGGKEMLPSLNIVRLFSLIILTTNISNYYLTVGLWSFNYEKLFRNIMIISFFMYLLSYLIFWILKIINVYTITLVPIFIDIYLIIHIFLFWNSIKIQSKEKRKNNIQFAD